MEVSRWPHLADEGDIQQWAEYRAEARHEFPRLIRRLINQTNDQVVRLEMRSGKGTDVTGYDGLVEAAQATPFVPDGLSVWELGTGGDPQDKANRDYRERTKNSLGIDKSTTTFVVPRTQFRPDTRLDPGGQHVESHGGRYGRGAGVALQRTQ